VKCIFALIFVPIIFKHPNIEYKKIVLMCVRDCRGAIEICLSEKGVAIQKKIAKH